MSGNVTRTGGSGWRGARRRWGWQAAVTGAAVGLTVLAAGCSGGGGGGTSGGAAAAPDHGVAGSAPQRVSGDAGGASGGAGSGAETRGGRPGSALPAGQPLIHGAVTPGRSIVYHGELVLRVTNVADAADRAVRIATSAGGYVFGEHLDGTRSADVTLKVPAAQFLDVTGQLAKLGTRLSSRQTAQDVTSDVVDLTARLATERASVARVRALLHRATDIGDVVDIEGELTRRQADLESLEGQLAVLQDQVALSTVDLTLTRHATPAPAGKDDHRTGFLGGLRHGWDAFVTAATGAATAIGAVLPFAVVLGVVAAIALWSRRGLRARRGSAEV